MSLLLRTAAISKQDCHCGNAFTARVTDVPAPSVVAACTAIATATLTLLFSSQNGYAESAAAPLCADFIERHVAQPGVSAATILAALKRFVATQQDGVGATARGRATFSYTVDAAHDHCADAEAHLMLRYYPDGYDERRWHVETPLHDLCEAQV